MPSDPSLTGRLQRFMEGDASAADSLLCEVLPRLREIALRQLRKERFVAPVTKTELINELWISSLSRGGWQIRDQGHFYALAGLAMRHVLVDLARKRLAARRGNGELPLSIEDVGPLLGASLSDAVEIVEIGILMDRLEAKHRDAARVVDMHYFGGFTFEEIAKETGLTIKQVRRRWETAMKWLKRKLQARVQPNSSQFRAAVS